ncbi:hypothetical protein GRI89_10940 [Altererythrobacter salegens]|uniref:EF-hand domain-containing protein n=1 Tax=Croceibacterium salegens TaxID=1737568 RepID=A0A6I4SV56_9SPHN|nr:hypothetical protein [Croceibacterium salegens]MXO60054.1 hypothetical protein [Croceibacterium salegens]
MILPFLSIIAVAQAAAASAPPPPPEPVRFTQRTFISPAGEPFRDYDREVNPIVTWFTAADINSDGKLDLGEFTADFMRYFKVLDRNRDGAIDGIERTYYEENIAPEVASFGWAGGGTLTVDDQSDAALPNADGSYGTGLRRSKDYDDEPPQGAAQFDLLGLPEPVAAMDVEIRGRVTRSTAQYVAGLRFQQLDKDSRGYLTLEGLPRTYAEQRTGMRR